MENKLVKITEDKDGKPLVKHFPGAEYVTHQLDGYYTAHMPRQGKTHPLRACLWRQKPGIYVAVGDKIDATVVTDESGKPLAALSATVVTDRDKRVAEHGKLTDEDKRILRAQIPPSDMVMARGSMLSCAAIGINLEELKEQIEEVSKLEIEKGEVKK